MKQPLCNRQVGVDAILAMTLLLSFIVASESSANGQTTMSVYDAKRCLAEAKCADTQEAAYSLAVNHQLDLLIKLASSAEPLRRPDIVAGIYESNKGRQNKSVIAFISGFSKSVSDSDRFDATTWYALQFLAERCNPHALRTLTDAGATGEQGPLMKFEISSEAWASSLHSFGACHYYASSDVLVHALDAANLDAGDAALKSLQRLYPNVCNVDLTMNCFEKHFRKGSRSQPAPHLPQLDQR
jgi:hypothetical protein